MNKDIPESSPLNLKKPNSPKTKDFLEVKIPQISFKQTNLNIYLVVSLVIFAFLLGMLTDKILFLQNALKTQTGVLNNTIAANNPPAAVGQYPTLPPKVDVAPGHLPVLGNENAKVTVIEFSDLQCPYCKQFHNDTYQQLYDAYIKTNKIKFAYRHYPLKSIHPNAQKSAEATECANEQGKFWEYIDLIFKNQSSWSPQAAADAVSSYTGYAGELGLNTDQFRSCLDSDKYAQNVQKDITDGDIAGVDGTPAFFINGWRLTGAQPFAQLQQRIEQELKK